MRSLFTRLSGAFSGTRALSMISRVAPRCICFNQNRGAHGIHSSGHVIGWRSRVPDGEADTVGQANRGTGHSHGRAHGRPIRCLVLSPTRELAMQVAENFEKYGKYHKLSMALLIGGVQMGDQVKALEKGVDVLIATPGRLMDLFGRGKIMLNGCDLLVIDEADRMLDMGFIPDIEEICSKLPKNRQTLLFSATMPPPACRYAVLPLTIGPRRPNCALFSPSGVSTRASAFRAFHASPLKPTFRLPASWGLGRVMISMLDRPAS